MSSLENIGSLEIHVVIQKIAMNCTNCHEKGKKFMIIRVNSLLN